MGRMLCVRPSCRERSCTMLLTVIAKFQAKSGSEEQVRHTLLGMTAPFRAEAGCLNYDIYQSNEDPTVLFTYENWTGESVLDEHMETMHFKNLGETLKPHLAVPMEIDLLTMRSAPAG